jgi:hypothetical protein
MGKNKFNSKMEKGKILIITSIEIDSFMLENDFSETTKQKIICIKKMYSNANLVLFFLNYSNHDYILDCFMPIYNNQTNFENLPIEKNTERVMLLTPILLSKPLKTWSRNEIEAIARKAFRKANWQKEYGFGVQEDGMTITQIDIAPYANEPISEGVINFWMEQLEFYKVKASQQPEFKPYLNEIVKDIEDMRRERDAVTGFRDLQIEAHDYALRLTNIEDGRFDARCYDKFNEFVDDFFSKIHKSLAKYFTFQITPAYGSAILLVDLVPEKTLPSEMEEQWEKGKNHLNKTVSAIPILVKKGEPEERINDFCLNANLDPEEANKILGSVKKLFPPASKKNNAVEIYSQTIKTPLATFNYNDEEYFSKAKKNLSDSLKPVADTIVSGYMGIIVGWEDEKMKFTILTNEGQRITIRYDKKQTDDVRKRFKTNVKLERIKEGRGWRLLSWK